MTCQNAKTPCGSWSNWNRKERVGTVCGSLHKKEKKVDGDVSLGLFFCYSSLLGGRIYVCMVCKRENVKRYIKTGVSLIRKYKSKKLERETIGSKRKRIK